MINPVSDKSRLGVSEPKTLGSRRRSKSKQKNEIEPPIPTTTAASSSSAPPPWIELPGDVTANILQRLGAQQILESAQKVCTTWWKVCQDPAVWRVIDLRNRNQWGDFFEFERVCRCAVDRSQGQLIDLTITGFGEDDLLMNIAVRSSHLRRLTISKPDDVLGWRLSQSLKKLPQLEELHLIHMSSAYPQDFETIGISCPMLESFTFSSRWSYYRKRNNYALAIGRNMPNLCHLRLFANRMKNEGLEAILDGCPHLESLDLRLCFSLDLEGVVGKRCCEQIKDVRLPSDSIADLLEWPVEPSD